MKRTALLIAVLMTGLTAFPQFISGDCCTCSAYFYGSSENYFRDSTISLLLDRNDNSFTESTFSVYAYTNGRISETIGYRFNRETSQREESHMQLKDYDIPGGKRISVNMRWDREEKKWTNSGRSTNFFNKQGSFTGGQYESYSPQTNRWEFSSRNEIISDSKNSSRLTLAKKWDKTSQKFILDSRTECTDNTEKGTRTCISFTLDRESAEWKEKTRTISIYNETMYLKSQTNYRMDTAKGEWEMSHISEYEYDLVGRKTKWYSWNIDKKTGDKKASGHQEYIYDKHGNNTEVLSYAINRENGNWELHRKQVFFWSKPQRTTNTGGAIQLASLKVYPNPFEDQAYVSLIGIENIKKIDLLDINSKLVRSYTDPGSGELIIERGDLEPGLYFIRVYSQIIFTGRIVVQ